MKCGRCGEDIEMAFYIKLCGKCLSYFEYMKDTEEAIAIIREHYFSFSGWNDDGYKCEVEQD